MAETEVRITGGCQCGAVRYTLSAPLTGSSICHCRMCQRAGGGPYMAFAGVRRSEIAWTGTPKEFASSTIATRSFCAECGTPLTFSPDGRDRVSVSLGSLDDPELAPPREQVGTESRLSWTAGACALPAMRTEDWLTGERATTFRSHQRAG